MSIYGYLYITRSSHARALTDVRRRTWEMHVMAVSNADYAIAQSFIALLGHRWSRDCEPKPTFSGMPSGAQYREVPCGANTAAFPERPAPLGLAAFFLYGEPRPKCSSTERPISKPSYYETT